jgi:hypothetical protein
MTGWRTVVRSWRVWTPTALLLVVAALQVTLATRASLSPWKGGGFGMFATTDGSAFRRVRLYVNGPDRSEEIAIPLSLDSMASRAALYPSERLLTTLAEAVAARELRHGQVTERVRVDVSRVAFEREPLTAVERPLRSLTYVVPPAPARSNRIRNGPS